MPEEKEPLNLPESKLPIAPLTKEEFGNVVKNRIERIAGEFRKGFEFLEGYERTVSFFGSARFQEDNQYYKMARELSARIGQYGITVVTGGGPGIMEAGNRGAYEKGAISMGLNIKLPAEQVTNPYLTNSTEFEYFFVRKVLLSYAAEAYVFFPGGFGTLDEFFEIITLVQTHKIEKVPIILMGTEYWESVHHLIEEHVYGTFKAIDREDMRLYTITDDIDEAFTIIKKAPIRQQT